MCRLACFSAGCSADEVADLPLQPHALNLNSTKVNGLSPISNEQVFKTLTYTEDDEVDFDRLLQAKMIPPAAKDVKRMSVQLKNGSLRIVDARDGFQTVRQEIPLFLMDASLAYDAFERRHVLVLTDPLFAGALSHSGQKPRIIENVWLFTILDEKNSVADIMRQIGYHGAVRTDIDTDYRVDDMKEILGERNLFHVLPVEESPHRHACAPCQCVKLSSRDLSGIQREVAMLVAAQGHPNVVKFHAVFSHEFEESMLKTSSNKQRRKSTRLSTKSSQHEATDGDTWRKQMSGEGSSRPEDIEEYYSRRKHKSNSSKPGQVVDGDLWRRQKSDESNLCLEEIPIGERWPELSMVSNSEMVALCDRVRRRKSNEGDPSVTNEATIGDRWRRYKSDDSMSCSEGGITTPTSPCGSLPMSSMVSPRKRYGLIIDSYSESLMDVVTNRLLEENVLKNVVAGLFSGLCHIHQNDIVHCNVNPNTIQMTPCGRPILTSFDCALRRTSVDELMQRRGSPYILAPELIRGEPTDIDTKIDIFAAGVVMYFSACGEMPFQAATLPKLYQTIVKGKYDTSKEVFQSFGEECMVMMRSLLAVEARKRPCAKDALSSNWLIGVVLEGRTGICARAPFSDTRSAFRRRSRNSTLHMSTSEIKEDYLQRLMLRTKTKVRPDTEVAIAMSCAPETDPLNSKECTSFVGSLV